MDDCLCGLYVSFFANFTRSAVEHVTKSFIPDLKMTHISVRALLLLVVLCSFGKVFAQEAVPKGTYSYEGERANSKKQGQGTCIWPNGDKYVGAFADDTMSGTGTMYYADSGKYEGEWKNGMRNGTGKYIWSSGNVYEGDFLNDMMHGQGTCTWTNGEKYEGQYVKNNRTGEGTYTWPNGDKYVGRFVDNMRSGKGTFYYENGARYEGGWKNDKKQGNGVFSWNNGDRYDGQFDNDLKNGYGNYFIASPKASVTIRFCPHCKKYMGKWKDGYKSGFGRCYNRKGKMIFEGEFVDDKPQGRYPTKKKKDKR